jgi:hypothetical protein
MAIIKTKATNILCYAHSLCVIRGKKKENDFLKKIIEKKERKDPRLT